MENKLIKLDERLYCLPYDKSNDRPNIYYIKGDDYSVCIDAGNSKKHVELLYNLLKENNLPLPSLTILTHWHWDHTFGLKYINGTSISTKLTHDKLIEVSKWKWSKEDMKHREETGEDIPFCTEFINVEYPDLNEISVVTSDKYIEEESEIDIGKIKLKLIPHISTHCDDSLYVYCKELNSLFVGDADGEDFYHGAIYDKDKLIDMINFYKTLDYERHFFCHYEERSKKFAISELEKILEEL